MRKPVEGVVYSRPGGHARVCLAVGCAHVAWKNLRSGRTSTSTIPSFTKWINIPDIRIGADHV